MTENKKPVGYLLERTTRLVKLQFHQSFKKLGLDMTPEQWVIMDALYQKNNQAQKDLGDASYKDAATISRILDVLAKKNWINREKSEEDRRIYIITQTKEGKAIVKKVLKEVERLRSQGWKNLNQKDYRDFTRIINQVFQNYKDLGK